MRTIIFIILATFTLTSFAQRSPVEKFIKKNAYENGVTVQEIHPGEMELDGQFKLEGKELKKALDQIEVIKIISVDNEKASLSQREEFHEKALKALDNKKYMELVEVNTDEEQVGMYAYQKNDGNLREMIILVNEADNLLMVFIEGDINLGLFASKDMVAELMKNKDQKNCE